MASSSRLVCSERGGGEMGAGGRYSVHGSGGRGAGGGGKSETGQSVLPSPSSHVGGSASVVNSAYPSWLRHQYVDIDACLGQRNIPHPPFHYSAIQLALLSVLEQLRKKQCSRTYQLTLDLTAEVQE